MWTVLQKYYPGSFRVFWHVLFWGTFVAAHTLYYGSLENDYTEELGTALRYLPFKMLVTYFTLYFTIPKYLLKKKYVSALLIFLISVAVSALIQQAVDYFILIPVFNPNWTETYYLFYPSKIFRTFLGMYPVVIIAAFIKLAKEWFEKEQQTQELHRQKLEAELNFLKAQIHPHFLFNTLNNLYSLTLKKSDQAPEVVMKLSELLNFMLYEGKTNTISVKKEIDLINHYTDLEKIRYDDRLDLTFKAKGDFTAKQIPPILILPLVENAFKHGGENETGFVSILIDIRLVRNLLTVLVKNSMPTKTKLKPDLQGGLGLTNIRRRLNLLYPEHHSLELVENETHFSVTLTIELDQRKTELL